MVDWPPVSSDPQVWQRAVPAAIHSHAAKVTPPFSFYYQTRLQLLIGQSDGEPNYLLHRHLVNTCMSVGLSRIVVLLIFVAEYFPWFRGKLEVTFPAKYKGPRMWLV